MSNISSNNQYIIANIPLTYKSVAAYAPSVKGNALSKSNREVRILLLFKQTKRGSGKPAIPFVFPILVKKQAGPFPILPES
jgi:hypothetical protein